MSATEMLSPLTDLATAAMESFVSWAQEHEWICRKSLFLVTPGEGLDAKALELAENISLDAGTMKVCASALSAVRVSRGCLLGTRGLKCSSACVTSV